MSTNRPPEHQSDFDVANMLWEDELTTSPTESELITSTGAANGAPGPLPEDPVVADPPAEADSEAGPSGEPSMDGRGVDEVTEYYLRRAARGLKGPGKPKKSLWD